MKILIISLAGIGNTLLTTPLIKLLSQTYRSAEISVLVMFKGAKELLETSPYVDKIIFWEFLKKGIIRSLKFLLLLRKKKFDVSILSYPSNRIEYNLIQFLIGAKVRLAHKYNHFFVKNLGFLNTKTIPEDDTKHDVEENVHLLSLLNKKIKNCPPPKVYLTSHEKVFAKNWLLQNNVTQKLIIGIHAGTATFKNQIKRRWDKNKFGELGKKLVQKYNLQILIFGGKEEEELKWYIKEKIGKNTKIVSDTTIRETTALISHCSLFISNDSGLMHLAASVGIPCIAIFGPTNPKWVHPYNTQYLIVRENLPCSPCFYYSQKPLTCKWGDFRCVKNISVEKVMRSVEKLLSGIIKKKNW